MFALRESEEHSIRVHKFSANLGETLKLREPVWWHEASPLLRCSNIGCTALQNSFATAIWRTGFVRPCPVYFNNTPVLRLAHLGIEENVVSLELS